MTLNLPPEIAAGLATLAAGRGVSIEEYLREIVEHELTATQSSEGVPPEQRSGMVFENGLLIYGEGTALPGSVVDEAIRRSREERSQHILGSRS